MDPREPHAGGVEGLVILDQDHPGFRDPEYRTRRNTIANLALEYREGEPVPRVTYTSEEQEVWRTVWESLDPLLQRYACAEYRESARAVALDREEIPQLADVNQILKPCTGFRMLPVAGLVSPRRFLTALDDRIFLSTQYIRHYSQPLYTPEPDIVHELIGHSASLAHDGFVSLSDRFGAAAVRCTDEEIMLGLIRLYWYTLEFGAVREDGEMKVYGAGLLSSFGELGRFEEQARLKPLDVDTIVATPFDPTAYQETIFVADSFAAMVEMVSEYVTSI